MQSETFFTNSTIYPDIQVVVMPTEYLKSSRSRPHNMRYYTETFFVLSRRHFVKKCLNYEIYNNTPPARSRLLSVAIHG